MTESNVPEGDDIDASPELPVHRRSTFTPPVGMSGAADGQQDTDDDALAAALASELARATRTGSIPVMSPEVDEQPVWSLDVAPQTDSVPAPEPEFAAPAVPPAESTTSAFVPSPLVPPVRQSLPDEALVQWIAGDGDGATLDAMEQLERELQLRQQDAQAFASWEQSMAQLGTPEALDALDRARSGFSDVLATTSIPTPVSPAEPIATDPPEATAPPAQPSWASEPDTVGFPPATMPDDLDFAVVAEHSDSEVLDAQQLANLAVAPAPQSAPYSDIPPPPPSTEAEAEAIDWGVASAAAVAPASGIPDLIEPHSIGDEPLPVGSDFDTLLAGAGLAEAADDTVDEQAADAEHGHDDNGDNGDNGNRGEDNGGDGVAFPLEVYEPGEDVPEIIELAAPRAFRVELAGLEPTPIEERVGRSARLFWIWFAANSSVISVALGAVIFSLGVSLRQAVIATLVGVCISSLPLGIGSLAGKRSGQPTMVVSRATFGLVGNILPALLAFFTRVFWGAVLLWVLALGVSAVNASTGAVALDASTVALVSLAVALLLAAVVAFFGYGLIARVQATLTVVSTVLVVGFIMLSWRSVDLRAAIGTPDGDWMLIATGAVLVFSVLGLVWAMSSADVARYQRPHSSSAGSMLWSWAGAALPAFVLIAYGSLLAASSPELLTGLLEQPVETLTQVVPAIYVYPMLAVLALGLLSGVVMTIYSGGFALQAAGLRAPRSILVIVVAVLTGAAAAGILVAVADFDTLLRDLATTIAVPVAAWAGVFSAELMMRSRRFDTASLLRRGGVYRDVRWVNLVTLVVASVVGFAFTSASVSWLSWQGFGWGLLGFDAGSVMADTDLGVIGALVLALLVTVIAGKPAINAQERNDRDAEPMEAVEPAQLD